MLRIGSNQSIKPKKKNRKTPKFWKIGVAKGEKDEEIFV